MTTTEPITVDISGAVKTFKLAGVNMHQAMPKLLARLSLKGEDYIKQIAPYRTGRLRGSISAYPKVMPRSIGSDMTKSGLPGGTYIGVNYAWKANVRSKSPRYIERTVDFVIKQIPIEADIVISNALKGMNK